MRDLYSRRITAHYLENRNARPELVGLDGRIDPAALPAEFLNPLFQVPTSRQAIPASQPHAEIGPVHPPCISMQIVGRDERSVRELLAKVDLRALARLTQGH